MARRVGRRHAGRVRRLALHAIARPDELVESRGLPLVDYLFVEEPYRRRGIGRALMLALEDASARGRRAGRACSTPAPGEDFAPARALYRSLGYLERGGRLPRRLVATPTGPGVHLVDELTMWVKPLR